LVVLRPVLTSLLSIVDSPISPALKTPSTARSRRKSSFANQASSPRLKSHHDASDGGDEEGEEDDFGDDFDDFEEGGEDADFGEFDDGFQQPETRQQAPPSPAPPSLSFVSAVSCSQRLKMLTVNQPVPDFDDLDREDILSATDPYLNLLFASFPDVPGMPPLSSKESSIFLTPRSASLWAQLVAPPPLQPPDWIRSRIRRLFLVSLGVPVDLDEILPASKQKKLILPSPYPRRPGSASSFQNSADGAGSRRSLSRLRREGLNASNTSLDSQARSTGGGASGSSPKKSRREVGGSKRGAPPFDLVTARQLCATTEEALNGMDDGELRDHVAKLQSMEETAKEVLEYWKKRTDEKIGDREAFEGVIENLVKHARKVRK
jgi:hypothetical protein